MQYNVTRWWWIRHATVPYSVHNGCFYGGNAECEPDKEKSQWLANVLPKDNFVCVTSAFKRTHQTADAIEQSGLSLGNRIVEPAFNEQDFGTWEGQPFSIISKNKNEKFWWNDVFLDSGGGESFASLFGRVKNGIDSYNAQYNGKNIICVSHAGTIRTAIGYVLNIPLADSHHIDIENQSVTVLEYYESTCKTDSRWLVKGINMVYGTIME